MNSLSRRDFLATVPLAALAAASCNRVPYRREDFVLPDRSPVVLLPAANYDADLAGAIGRGLDMLHVSAGGRRVFLKPNFVEYETGSAINIPAADRPYLPIAQTCTPHRYRLQPT